MFEGMEIERPREALSRNPSELREEARVHGYCARCLCNAGLRVKVTGKYCPNCGATTEPIQKI